jgi:hypothetical protein
VQDTVLHVLVDMFVCFNLTIVPVRDDPCDADGRLCYVSLLEFDRDRAWARPESLIAGAARLN